MKVNKIYSKRKSRLLNGNISSDCQRKTKNYKRNSQKIKFNAKLSSILLECFYHRFTCLNTKTKLRMCFNYTLNIMSNKKVLMRTILMIA